MDLNDFMWRNWPCAAVGRYHEKEGTEESGVASLESCMSKLRSLSQGH